jgi:hypothetical protein
MNRLLFLLPVLFMACGTPPKAATEAFQAAAVKEPEEEPAVIMPAKEEVAEKPAEKEPVKPVEAEPAVVVAAAHSSGGLEDESYEEVFNEVKAFIENLNIIIKNKDFNKWKEALSQERFNEISSREFLTATSNSTSMKRRGIVLKELKDYFNFVVVPSRANSQVDKIEILGNNRVKAYYYKENSTVQLYELEKRGNIWTIIQ